MAKVRKLRQPAGEKADRAGQRKMTMWLPDYLAKRLRHAAIEDDREIGQVAAEGIALALAGRYWTDRERPARPAARPAIAADPSGPADGEAGPQLRVAGE